MHPNGTTGMILNSPIPIYLQWTLLLVCIVFAVVAHRRTRNYGFIVLLAGLVISFFNSILFSPWVIQRLHGPVVDTLQIYGLAVGRWIFWLFLAIAIWRIGITLEVPVAPKFSRRVSEPEQK